MKKALAAVSLSLAVVGCGDLDIPDLNNPSSSTLEENPTRSVVASASTGLLMGARTNYAAANGYVAMTGILGRELYNLDAADPRFVTEMLAAPQLDPGSPAFGGNLWNEHYRNIRNAGLVRGAVDKVAGLSAAEAEAIRGFSKTIEAWNFLMIASTRQEAPIDVHRKPGDALAPLEPNAAVLAHAATLLDEGRAHLEAGGDAFPFALSTGFKHFETPETFILFNRALRARVAAYQQDWPAALEAVNASFLDTAADMELGVFHTYSNNAGDTANGLNSPNLYVHPSISAQMDRRLENGAPDQRVTRSVRTMTKADDDKTEVTLQGLTSTQRFRQYESGEAPVPIIRNEELILLRAEANIHLGQVGLAADDINVVRTVSASIDARTDLTADNILDELLKQRRYSLLFEGGHSWIDARRYGRIESLPLDLPTHTRHLWYPVPEAEMNARE